MHQPWTEFNGMHLMIGALCFVLVIYLLKPAKR